MFLLLLAAATLSAADVNQLAGDRAWDELASALAHDGAAPARTAEEIADYTAAQQAACMENAWAVAESLGKLGGQAGLWCLAKQEKWEAVAAQVTTMQRLPDEEAGRRRLAELAKSAASSGQMRVALDLTRVTPTACQPVFEGALTRHDTAVLERLAARCPALARPASQLVAACRYQDLGEVQFLVGAGFDPRASDEGSTCLYWAAQRGDMAMVRFLLDHGADVSAVTDDGHSVLASAVVSGNPDLVQLLLAKGADARTAFGAADEQFLSFDKTAAAPPDDAKMRQILSLLHGGGRAVIIVGGGKDDAELHAAEEAWNQVAPLATQVLGLAPGVPLHAKSDDVSGLKPGFQVLLLAAGPESELTPFLPLVQAIRPGSYLRKVEWTPESGPVPLRLNASFDKVAVKQRTVKGRTLRIAALWSGQDVRVLATLYDAKGAQLDQATAEKAFGLRCDSLSLYESGSGFRISGDCDTPGCTDFDLTEMQLDVGAEGKAIRVDDRDRLLRKGGCD